jgi:cytochrome c-type biogenesis protein
LELLIASFLAGVLTILAPCVLPLLPVIIGGSLTEKNIRRPIVITLSLAGSIVVFTLLLKTSTLLIDIPQRFWQIFSGSIVLFFGVITLFPALWEKVSIRFGFGAKSQTALSKAGSKKGIVGEVLIGASLGPVFASCSPTYLLIVATVIPASFAVGTFNLVAYAIGLSVVMLAIALLGQRFLAGAKWAADPHGIFKKVLGIIFILVGIFVLTGIDKKFESYLLDKGIGVTSFEERFLEKVKE